MQEKIENKTTHKAIDLIEQGHLPIDVVDTLKLKKLLVISIELERYKCCQMIKEELLNRKEWD